MTTTQKKYSIGSTGHTLYQHDPEQLGLVGTVPHNAFSLVLIQVNSLALDKAKLLDDVDLSGPGKERRLTPLYIKAWEVVCFAHAELSKYRASTAQREARLLALPTLDTSAVAVCLEDIEARQAFRSLSPAERGEIMAAMQRDEASAARYARLQIAVLRSPMPMLLDRETEFFRAEWIKTARLNNVGEAIAIDGEKAAANWAVRGLAQLVGILHSLTSYSREDLLRFLIADAKRADVAAALGFSAFDVAGEKARQEAAKRMAAVV